MPRRACLYQVLADVGAEAYMHRPLFWATLQFAPSGGAKACRQIEWPGRYLARLLFAAQAAHLQQSSTYSESAAAGCDADSLRLAVGQPKVFDFRIHVDANASALSRACVARPCFVATVRVAAPLASAAATSQRRTYRYNTSVDTNSRVTTEHSLPRGKRPCL
jgi:hypothetical protein